MSERGDRRRPALWRRLGPAERTVAVVIAVITAAGLLLIADGLYLKARAGIMAGEHPGTSTAPRVRRADHY